MMGWTAPDGIDVPNWWMLSTPGKGAVRDEGYHDWFGSGEECFSSSRDRWNWAILIRRQLKRGQVEKFFTKLAPAVVGMEACGGAHHWARLLQRLGHEVRLMPAAYVKPYVKRNKTDGRDAEAICEAPPTMRFVAVKRPEAAGDDGDRTRALLVRQRTMAAKALRAAFAEFGWWRRKVAKGWRR